MINNFRSLPESEIKDISDTIFDTGDKPVPTLVELREFAERAGQRWLNDRTELNWDVYCAQRLEYNRAVRALTQRGA